MDGILVGIWGLLLVGLTSASGPPRATQKTSLHETFQIRSTRRLVCPVESNPPAFIEWQKDGMTIDDMWERYKVHNDVLRIKDVHQDDAGLFSCKAVNGFGSISINFTIYVQDNENGIITPPDNNVYPHTPRNEGNSDQNRNFYGPRFKDLQKMKHIEISRPFGTSVRFRCKAEGNPTPQVTWFKDDNVIKSDHSNEKRPGWILKKTELTANDSGTYKCIVTNDLGSISYSYNLRVIDKVKDKPPRVVAPHPLNTTVKFGDRATLQCKVESENQPHIQWLKKVEGSDIINASSTINIGDHRFKVLKTSDVWPGPSNTYMNKLVIKNARASDSGLYLCLGANGQGYNYRSAHLSVIGVDPEKSALEESSTGSLPWMITIPALIVVGVVIVAIIFLQRSGICCSCCRGNKNNSNPRFEPVATREAESYPSLNNVPRTNLHINPMGNPVRSDIYMGMANPHLMQSSKEKLSKQHSIDFYTDISSVSQSRNNPQMHPYGY